MLLCIWLLPTNESLESWFLRIAIVAINGLCAAARRGARAISLRIEMDRRSLQLEVCHSSEPGGGMWGERLPPQYNAK